MDLSIFCNNLLINEHFGGLQSTSPKVFKKMAVEIEELKLQANNCFKQKDFKKAIQLYSQAILGGDDVEMKSTLLSNRSQCYINVGDYKKAVEDCKLSITLNGNVKSQYRLHLGLFHLGDFEQSFQVLKLTGKDSAHLELILEDYSKLLQNPDLQRIENLMYRILQYNKSESSLDFSSRLIPIKIRLMRISALLDRNYLDDANEAIRKELMDDQKNPDTLYYRAKALYLNDSGNDHVIKMLGACLQYDPDHQLSKTLFKYCKRMDRLRQQGNEAFKLGQFDNALEFYGEFIENDTLGGIVLAKIYSNRAIVYSRRNLNDKVLQDCELALNLMDSLLFPKLKKDEISMEDRQMSQHTKLYSKIYLRRADVYSKEEKFEEALREYDNCKILDPENRGLNFNRNPCCN